MEYSNWKAHTENKYKDTLLENYVVDNAGIMQDVGKVEMLVDKGGDKPPDPPDTSVNRKDVPSAQGSEGCKTSKACDAMHLDGPIGQNGI